jgi:DNA replication protein DnaC
MTFANSATLDRMLTRLKLNAVRDHLDHLRDEAALRKLTVRQSLPFLCESKIARKDQRRIIMGMGIARFPAVRTSKAFNFEAHPSVDAG